MHLSMHKFSNASSNGDTFLTQGQTIKLTPKSTWASVVGCSIDASRPGPSAASMPWYWARKVKCPAGRCAANCQIQGTATSPSHKGAGRPDSRPENRGIVSSSPTYGWHRCQRVTTTVAFKIAALPSCSAPQKMLQSLCPPRPRCFCNRRNGSWVGIVGTSGSNRQNKE